jgi:acetyl esterase/lipase
VKPGTHGATYARRRGYQGIEIRRKPLSAALAVLLALVLLATLPAGPAFAAPATGKQAKGKKKPKPLPTIGGVSGPIRKPPKPQLLLFHGGSFIYEDPKFEPETVGWAKLAGFVPHYITYPLGNIPAALEVAKAEARAYAKKVGADKVFAYGASAGGTLAALLASEGLVAAAATKAPVSDLVAWEYGLNTYGSDYYSKMNLDLEGRYQLSPINREVIDPLLIFQGRIDNVVPAAMNQTYADLNPSITYWSVAGGHATDEARPWLIQKAMNWLGEQAQRLSDEAAEEEDP